MHVTTVIFYLALVAAPLDGAKTCTSEDMGKAEKVVFTWSPKEWSDVYKVYKKFGHCDDGAVGEGYSEAVATLLGNRWGKFDQLNKLVSRDKRFERFVLDHINALMSVDEARKIRGNAVAQCTPAGKQLCESIVKKLDQTSF